MLTCATYLIYMYVVFFFLFQHITMEKIHGTCMHTSYVCIHILGFIMRVLLHVQYIEKYLQV